MEQRFQTSLAASQQDRAQMAAILACDLTPQDG
jgi:hypothetical protein